jgi:hypothetical protein
MMNGIILLLMLLPVTGSFDGDSAEKITASEDSIRGSNIIRSEDLFRQTGFGMMTIDRMSVRLSDRMSGYDGLPPVFLLDGIPVDPAFFGMIYPQHIPVAHARIKNIGSGHGAGQRSGIPFTSGSIHLEMKERAQGFSLFYSGQIGHNGGEPGPWIYDPERVTPNIERFGPWIDGEISAVSDRAWVRGLIRYHNYYHVDPSVQNRIRQMRGFPDEHRWLDADSNTLLGKAEAGISAGNAEIRTRAQRSRSDEFLFLRPLGREVPATLQLDQYTADLQTPLGGDWKGRLMVQYTGKSTGYRTNRFGHHMDWEEHRQYGVASLSRSDQTVLGFELDQSLTKGTGGYRHQSGVHPAGFIQQKIRFSEGSGLTLFGRLQRGENAHAVQMSAEYRQRLGGGLSAGIELFYNEHLPEEMHPLDVRTADGFGLLDHLQIPFERPSEIDKQRSAGIFIKPEWKPSEAVVLTGEAGLIRDGSINIPEQPVSFDSTFTTMPGTYRLQTGLAGTRIDGAISLEVNPSRNMTNRIRVNTNRTLSGDELYRQYRQSVPRVVEYEAEVRPYPDLTLFAAVRYRSSTTWHEFEALDGEQVRSFHVQYRPSYYDLKSTLPAHLNLDLRVAKWFWEQRLRGVFQLSNILNRADMSHPLSVQERFGFMARVEIRL